MPFSSSAASRAFPLCLSAACALRLCVPFTSSFPHSLLLSFRTPYTATTCICALVHCVLLASTRAVPHQFRLVFVAAVVSHPAPSAQALCALSSLNLLRRSAEGRITQKFIRSASQWILALLWSPAAGAPFISLTLGLRMFLCPRRRRGMG